MSVSNSQGSVENLFDSEQPLPAWGRGWQRVNFWGSQLGVKRIPCQRAVATDSVSDLLPSISYSVQEEFDELISGDNNKKTFSLGLSRIFALLLNIKV